MAQNKMVDVLSTAPVVSNNTLNFNSCNTTIPTALEYFAVTGIAGLSLAATGFIIFLVTLALYCDTVAFVGKRVAGPAKTHTAFIVTVYPVVSLCAFIALLVPRAQLVTESAAQAVLMIAMYQLLCLFVDYCGGETEIVRQLTAAELGATPKVSLRVTPCCCWPCLPLPDMPLTKRSFIFLRVMVLQLPVVQNLIYLTVLVASADTEGLGDKLLIPMIAPMLTSILIGIWGLKATLTSLAPLLENPQREHSALRKFVALQLVLLLTKLQGGIIKGIASAGWIPCTILPPILLANIFYNCALLVEMFLLMVAGRYLYKREITGIEPDPEAKPALVQNVPSKKDSSTDNNNTIDKMCHRL